MLLSVYLPIWFSICLPVGLYMPVFFTRTSVCFPTHSVFLSACLRVRMYICPRACTPAPMIARLSLFVLMSFIFLVSLFFTLCACASLRRCNSWAVTLRSTRSHWRSPAQTDRRRRRSVWRRRRRRSKQSLRPPRPADTEPITAETRLEPGNQKLLTEHAFSRPDTQDIVTRGRRRVSSSSHVDLRDEIGRGCLGFPVSAEQIHLFPTETHFQLRRRSLEW